ncbi:MAG: hypothetical protein WB992_06790 [Bryobacteraceae bacterium]
MRIEFSEFFTRYLDPLREELAEWGAFAGLHERGRDSAMDRVRKLASTAIAKAGLGAPARLARAHGKVADIERAQQSIRDRMKVAYRRLIGVAPFSSQRPLRKAIEGLIDFVVLILFPAAYLAAWPVAALRGWRVSRLEMQEGAFLRLEKATVDYLTIEFDWYFEKGEEARRANGSAGRAAAVGGRPADFTGGFTEYEVKQ